MKRISGLLSAARLPALSIVVALLVGGVVAGFAFCIELAALGGRARLGNRPVAALIAY